MLVAALASLGGSWTTWRAAQLGNEHPAAPEPAARVAERPAMLETARTLAEATAADGRQRALDSPPAGLEDLQQLRLAVCQAICSAPAGTPIRHVQPWLWSAATSGGVLSPRAGAIPVMSCGCPGTNRRSADRVSLEPMSPTETLSTPGHAARAAHAHAHAGDLGSPRPPLRSKSSRPSSTPSSRSCVPRCSNSRTRWR
jgi:hypothetical protein